MYITINLNLICQILTTKIKKLLQTIVRTERQSAIFMIFCEKNEGATCKNEQDARIRIKKKALTPHLVRCECPINNTLSAIPFPLCRHISRSFDGLGCMKPTTESEILVLFVFLATVSTGLATNRTSTNTCNGNIVTSHESKSDLSNMFLRIRFRKESEKAMCFIYILTSEIFYRLKLFANRVSLACSTI